MIDLSKQRWLIVAVAHYLLYFFVSQLNHYMTPFTLNAHVFGVLVAFSGLNLSYRQGLASLVPVAFAFDSRSPLQFGSMFLLCLAVYSLVFLFRQQFRKESQAAGAIVSVAANALIFIGITFFALVSLGGPSSNFPHIFANLIWSGLVVLLLSKYYFEFVYGCLSLFGINLAEEQRNQL